jgi:hypothetical protein
MGAAEGTGVALGDGATVGDAATVGVARGIAAGDALGARVGEPVGGGITALPHPANANTAIKIAAQRRRGLFTHL